MRNKIHFVFLIFLIAITNMAAAEVVIIGHEDVPKIDVVAVQKIYSGKFISVDGVNITPVSLKTGAAQRDEFLKNFMNQDEEKYTAYWTVRKYVGKGTPPNEVGTAADVINFIQSTPGAVGYIDETEVKDGVHILLRHIKGL
jgi:ABC-type phosphate transport system substrate-binding protein